MAKKTTKITIEFEDANEAKELHDALELVLELAAANPPPADGQGDARTRGHEAEKGWMQ